MALRSSPASLRSRRERTQPLSRQPFDACLLSGARERAFLFAVIPSLESAAVFRQVGIGGDGVNDAPLEQTLTNHAAVSARRKAVSERRCVQLIDGDRVLLGDGFQRPVYSVVCDRDGPSPRYFGDQDLVDSRLENASRLEFRRGAQARADFRKQD